ncbi:hypothetical protein [Hyphomicrobium sp. MC1]|nr:hypothetical protein [Hyphomicrobium sp. MC1]
MIGALIFSELVTTSVMSNAHNLSGWPQILLGLARRQVWTRK